MVANALRSTGCRADAFRVEFIGKGSFGRSQWLWCRPRPFCRAALGLTFSPLIGADPKKPAAPFVRSSQRRRSSAALTFCNSQHRIRYGLLSSIASLGRRFVAFAFDALRGSGFGGDAFGVEFIGKRPFRRNQWLWCRV